jgi:hypothetical protein
MFPVLIGSGQVILADSRVAVSKTVIAISKSASSPFAKTKQVFGSEQFRGMALSRCTTSRVTISGVFAYDSCGESPRAASGISF